MLGNGDGRGNAFAIILAVLYVSAEADRYGRIERINSELAGVTGRLGVLRLIGEARLDFVVAVF